MKSIFRRPSDSNSSSASTSESSEDVEVSQDPGEPSSLPHTASDILQPDFTATGAGSQGFNPLLALYSPLHPAIPSLPQNHHFTFLISSLLENYVRTRVPNNPVLAENLYTEIAQRLPDLGIAPKNSQHFSRAELASVRQGYLDGLDGLLQQALEKNNDQNTREYVPGDLSGAGQMSIVRRDNNKPTLRRMVTELPGGGRSVDERRAIHRSSSLSVLVDAVKPTRYRPSTAPVFAESPPLFFPENTPPESIPEIGIVIPPRYSRYTSDFVEIGFLGRGGFGSVYHARNRLDNVDYAVKKVVLKNEMFQKIQDGGIGAFNRILSEVQTMAKLEHRNIVRYYGGWIEGLVGEKFIPAIPAIPAEVDAGVNVPPVVSILSEDLGDGGLPEAAELAEISDGGILFAYSDSESRVQTLEDSTTGLKGTAQNTRASEKSGGITKDEEDSDDSVEWIPRSYPPRVKLATSHPKPQRLSSGRTGKNPKVLFELSVSSPDHSESEDISGSNYFSAGNGALVKSAPRAHGKGHSRSSSAPIVTLHIQMSLHPLVLTSYLSPSPNGAKHCFCLAAALRLFLGLVDGVDYLHQKGIVHRDLKPGNVFLDIIGTRNICACPGDPGATVVPRIGDFGLVKQIHGASEGVGGNQNAAVGTEFYRPPAAKASQYDMVKRDLFALGVILVELVCRFGTRKFHFRMLHPGYPNLYANIVGMDTCRYGTCAHTHNVDAARQASGRLR